MSTTVEELAVEFGARGHERMGNTFAQLLTSTTGLVSALTELASVWITSEMVQLIVNLGVESDRTFRQIGALLPTAMEGIKELRDGMDALAIASGRTLDDVHKAGIEIARLGVSDAAEVVERLNAAMLVSDATGTDLRKTIEGLDQVMDTFGLSSEQATETLASLVSAAKGRVDLDSLFDSFRRVAPTVQRLGIDADTTTRALVALLDRGFNVRQAGSFLEKLDAKGIRQIATEATISTTKMQDLAASADLVRNSLDHITEGTKSRLKSWAQFLGDIAVPVLKTTLTTFNQLLDAMGRLAKTGNINEMLLGDILPERAKGHVRSIDYTTPKNDLGNYGRAALPKTIAEQEEAEKKSAQVARAAHDLAMDAARDHYAKLIALADNWAAQMRRKYGADSKEYIDALRARERIAADHARDVQEETFRRGMAAITSQFDLQLAQAGINYEQQLVLARGQLAAIAYLYGTQSSEYAEMQRRILAIQKEALNAQDANERDHQELMNRFAREEEQREKESVRKNKETAREAAGYINDIVTSLYNGDGIEGAAKQFASKMLKGLGETMMAQANIYGIFGGIMQSLSAGLANPFTAGPAALAIGAALYALGSALGASAHGGASKVSASGGRGGYGGGYTASMVVPPVSAPSSAGTSTRNLAPIAPITVNATIIGKDDPRAQRELLEMISRAGRRGSTSG